MTLSNRNHPYNAGVNADRPVGTPRTDLRGNPLEPDEYDPIQLRFDMGWTVQRLASEMDYSISSALYWSSRRSTPGRQAKKKAYEVRQKYLETSGHTADNTPTQEDLLAAWKLLQALNLSALVGNVGTPGK